MIKGEPKFCHLCYSLRGALSAGKGGQVWFTGVNQDYCYSSSGGGDNNTAQVPKIRDQPLPIHPPTPPNII